MTLESIEHCAALLQRALWPTLSFRCKVHHPDPDRGLRIRQRRRRFLAISSTVAVSRCIPFCACLHVRRATSSLMCTASASITTVHTVPWGVQRLVVEGCRKLHAWAPERSMCSGAYGDGLRRRRVPGDGVGVDVLVGM
ncbi:hypothetical protein C8J57DRAFT_1495139 [Mycena rebaudengoi]|nr:hypothetical protein C8J57DRAFT_1495139 [Mycena rebaudengoi]